MRDLVKILVVGAALAMLAGCASPLPIGGLYTEVKMPVAAGTATSGKKIGEAECQSILGMIATGDCSIETAKKRGNIRTVSHVDWSAKNILGVIGNYKVVVYGD